MKKWYLITTFLCSCMLSCGDSDILPPGPPPPPPPSETTIPLFFVDDIRGDTAHYEGVKIGEYLWMNRNIHHFTQIPVTRPQLDLVLTRYRLDPANFQVSIDDFNKYYGQYYSVDYIYYHLRDGNHGLVYEGKERELLINPETNLPEWRLANKADFRQLFAMCGDASEYAVRTALACRPYENPAAVPVSYWINGINTNRYGFNAMPTGARHHAPDQWSTDFNDGTPPPVFQNQAGDFYNTFMTIGWAVADGTVRVHDYVDTEIGYLYHLQNIRFCRRLADQELGYKLYIKADVASWNDMANEYQSKVDDYSAELLLVNNLNRNLIQPDKVDILKADIDQNAPAGYVELRKGYIRGFYVQYILDIEQPTRDVSRIMNMVKTLR